MFKKIIAYTSTVIIAATVSGCASIVSDSNYPVAINSTPSGASYNIVNKKGVLVHSGTTPEQVTLKSGSSYFSGEKYQIAYVKENFEPKTTTLDTTVDGWYWANLLFGGLPGMLIFDPITGAMYKLPEKSHTSLSPLALKNKSE